MLNRNRLVEKDEISEIDLADRVEMEAKITDSRAEHVDLQRFLSLTPERYTNGIGWRQHAFETLGDLRGKRVLDICCGYSMTPIVLALSGAEQVVAVDVSPVSLEKVEAVAELRGVSARVKTHCGPVESLPFEDDSFDRIYGGAALHHLVLDQAVVELSRLLAPDGVAVFQDPLGHNRLLEFARDNLNYAGKHAAKGTDHPLTVTEIERFGRNFKSMSWRGFDLIASVSRAARPLKRLRAPLEKIDRAIFRVAPGLQRYARFAVITVAN